MDSESVEPSCWICKREELALIRQSRINANLSPKDFAITDRRYGMTASIYQCLGCGFQFCADIEQVLGYYENLTDEEYETSKPQRSLQANRLLRKIRTVKTSGRLFDIGAGAGNLIQEAIKMGYDATGIEPSRWLWRKAKESGINVICGTLPHIDTNGGYEIATMIDVIEHVQDPIGLLQDARQLLSDDGIAVIVTPDVGSLTARVMGSKWWHYRIAHIGYFNRQTLFHALAKSGLRPISVSRPGWYLSTPYILERLSSYLPLKVPANLNSLFSKIIIPVNFFDSLMVIVKKS